MWLPDEAFRALGSRRVLVAVGPDDGPVAETVVAEVAPATAQFGGHLVTAPVSVDDALACDVVLAIVGSAGQVGTASATMPPPPGATPRTDSYRPAVQAVVDGLLVLGRSAPMNPGMFGLARHDARTVVVAGDAAGLLYGLHELVRRGEAALTGPDDFVWDLPVNDDPHARPLGQHRRPPGHGSGRARVRGRLALLRRRPGPRRPVPRRAVRAAARVGAGSTRSG